MKEKINVSVMVFSSEGDWETEIVWLIVCKSDSVELMELLCEADLDSLRDATCEGDTVRCDILNVVDELGV